MRTAARLLSLLGLLLVAATAAPAAMGQCPGGYCPAPVFHPAPHFAPGPVFVQPHYHPSPVVIRPAQPAAPEPTPAPEAAPEPVVRNFGLDSSKIGTERRYILNGREVSRATAVEAVADVPDDSKKFHVVVIGPEPDRRRVTDPLGLASALTDRVIVHSWPADSPLVAQRRFVVDGSPTVYVLGPDGRVLGRSRGGKVPAPAEIAAAVLRAVSAWDAARPRPAGPYDPAKDPDLFAEPKPPPAPPVPPTPDKPAPGPGGKDVPPWVYVGGLILVYLLAKGK